MYIEYLGLLGGQIDGCDSRKWGLDAMASTCAVFSLVPSKLSLAVLLFIGTVAVGRAYFNEKKKKI